MLDEFPALGRIPVIAESTAFLPGYNVRTVIIVQSNSQLIEKYGIEGARSIRKMLAARIVFPPREFDDAEAISRELGTYTVKQKNVSRPMWGGAGKSPTVSISEQPRRLLLPQEVKELGADRMILFYEGLRPVLADRVYYFRDKYLAKRELPPPAVPILRIAKTNGQLPGARASGPRSTAAGNPAWNAAEDAAAGSDESCKEFSEMAADEVLRDELRLEDFSFDFDDEQIPKEKLSDADMKLRADEFMASVLD
jgi:type IV secretion system protein VirD4